MRKFSDYLVIKQQIKAFEALGYPTQYEILGYHEGFAFEINILMGKTKAFICSPDWRKVSKSLAEFYIYHSKVSKKILN